MSARVAALGALVASGAAGCKPDLDQTVSIVTGARILAVRSDPAEAAPGASVQYSALYVDATGAIPSAPLAWAFCNARKPLAQLGPVSPQCLQVSGDWFVPMGAGEQVSGTLPDIACRQFGPDVPEPAPKQPPGRPVDPDTTGGYYQPVRLLAPAAAGDVIAISETRLSCGLAGATPDQVVAFHDRYRANVNPAIDQLEVVGAGPVATDDRGLPYPVKAGDRVPLRVTWAACPEADSCGDGVCGPDETLATCAADCTKPRGCTGAERYAVFDLGQRALVDTREGVHVSWFATGGSFAIDRTGRDPEDLATTSDDQWTAPATPGTVHMWIVLLDDRGGTGWAEYAFAVR